MREKVQKMRNCVFWAIFDDFLRDFLVILYIFSPFLLKMYQILGERGGGEPSDSRPPLHMYAAGTANKTADETAVMTKKTPYEHYNNS